MLKRGIRISQDTESREMSVTKNEFASGAEECESIFIEGSGQRVTEASDVEKTSSVSKCAIKVYLQGLAQNTEHEDIDFELVESMLLDGADVNYICEDTGQSVVHEVAANWDTEVADFFLNRGGDIMLKDKYGRTPLHIAASMNHVKMIEWLVSHNVDIEAETFDERQTPFHYAARYNSVEALELLFDKCCNQEAQDYQGRTPLHLTAELDRTNAADCLITLPVPAEVRVQDQVGNIAVASMTRTMPTVVSSALDQLCRISSPARKQYFILSHLEPNIKNYERGVKTPFEVAVEERQRQVLSHKVMQTLIAEKWQYIRWLFYPHLVFNIIYIIIWSFLIGYPSVQKKHIYEFPRDSWRVIVSVIGLLLFLMEIFLHIFEMARSIQRHRVYVRNHIQTVRDDLAIPTQSKDEKAYLQAKITEISKSWPSYFRDRWNICSLASIFLLLIFIVLHIADVASHSVVLATWVARVSCLVVILMWVCLLKQARGFRALGALIAIVGELFGDIFRFFFLYAILFIPFFVAFWVMFGGDQSVGLSDENREDFTSFFRVIIMVFRMTLVDDYPYSSMRDLDEAMAAILVIAVLLFLAVVALNLFIALLSDTFQRVYDNAQANSLLEQARLIYFYEMTLPARMQTLYLEHIHTKCNPLEKYYDDDEDGSTDKPAELKKIAHQINDKIVAFAESKSPNLEEVCSEVSSKIDVLESKVQLLTQQLEAVQIVLENNAGGQVPRMPVAETIHLQPAVERQQESEEMRPSDPQRKMKLKRNAPARLGPADSKTNMGSTRQLPAYYSQYSIRPQAVGRLNHQESIAKLVPTHRRVVKNVKQLEEEFQWKRKLQPYSRTKNSK